MSATTLEKWIWPLIFVGLLVAGLGLSIGNIDAGFGAWVVGAGLVLALLGVLMIYLRSRIEDGP